ncbi:putative lysophospholipase [Butyriboletus roseoflavus]|nr:putative lysophospholipase [Butyriboletus roseoflavus]
MLQTNIVWLWLCLSSLPAWLVAAQSIASQAYTPVAGACSQGFTLVRMAGSSPGNQSLSTSEASYVQARRSEVIPQAWKTYLANVEATNVTLPSYVSSILSGSSSQTPNFGIATSGGGYRAAIFGAGVLNALDGRNASSNSAGIGGLLQTATYLAGLSGGSWFLTSLAQANFPTMQELVFGYPNSTVANNSWGGWNANYSVYAPSSDPVTDAEYLVQLVEELEGKYDAGYNVTFADVWSRALARHFVNGTFPSNFYDESYTHGAGILWSSVSETESFTSYAMPFPIVVSDVLAPGQNTSNDLPGDYVPISNPIFEFNVFEMGSYDPMLSAFAPTKYLGTRNNSICITNYDQSALVAGTSSELFNEYNVTGTLESLFGPELSLLNSLLPESGIELDAASWPNPFYGVAPETFSLSNQTDLTLVDGGEDGEVIPLQPLLVKARDVDTILAIDASSDVNNFAAGDSLIATQDRAMLLSSAYSFPPVPTTTEEFTAQNLSTRPTFFGCDTTSTPLLIYLANGGPPHNGEAPVTNTSTSQVAYDSSEIQAMLDQTFIIATQGYPANSSVATDPEWPACLACAIVDRARERAGETRSGVCECCFARYCWSGSTLSTRATQSSNEGPRILSALSLSWTSHNITFVFVSLVVLYAVARAIYHLFLSPLSAIPGPWYAAVSDFWITTHVLRLQQCKTNHQLFEEYGPVVRVGPKKVIFKDITSMRSVYSIHKFDKSKFYKSLLTNENDHAMTTLDHIGHAVRRKGYAQHYIPANLALFQVEAHEHVLELVTALEHVGGKYPLDCLALFRHFMVDVIISSSHGYRQGALSSWILGGMDPIATAISDFPKRGIVRSTMPSCLWNLVCRIPSRRWRQICDSDKIIGEFVGARVYEMRAKEGMGGTSDSERITLLQRLLEYKYSPHQQMPDHDIISEMMGHMIAGSDTTSNSMSYFFWELTRRPDIMSKLQAELDLTMPDSHIVPDLAVLQRLPYLNAFIKEGLRLYSAAPSDLERVVPSSSSKNGALDESFDLMGYALPPGTVIATQAWSMHRDPTIFPSPDSFVPERWLQGPDATAKMAQYLMPFGTGSRQCGGMNLAYMMLRLTVAALVRNFNVTAPPETNETSMEIKDAFVIFPAAMECKLAFHPRN